VTEFDGGHKVNLTFPNGKLPGLVNKQAPDMKLIYTLQRNGWIRITRRWKGPSARYYQLTRAGREIVDQFDFDLRPLRVIS